MARELRLVLWCDGDHDEDVAATATREEQMNGKPYLLDLCESCAERFDKDVATVHAWLESGVLAEQAVAVPGEKPEPRKRRKGRVGRAPTRTPDEALRARTDCPECDYVGSTRGAMGQHLRKVHGKMLTDYDWSS